jgi:predicted transcriptional regulator
MRTVRERPVAHAKRRRRMTLGPFETRVMEVLWKFPECTVQEVKEKLARKRAYTTVMTTLVRLCQKGLLRRRKQGHRFVYSSRLSAEEWGRLAAAEFLSSFVSVPSVTHELLVRWLLEALDKLDAKLRAERLPANGADTQERQA